MRVALLGPLRVANDDGTPIDIGGARLRMLLARLALDAGRAVPAEALIDGLWGSEPPADAANALQSLVSRLRRALPVAIESGTGGYRLDVAADDVDVTRFERLAADGRRRLAAGHDGPAAEMLTEAVALWHGDALSDVLDAPFARVPATRLDELRAEAAEDRFEAEIRLGRHGGVLADLTTAAGAYPLRERLAGLRIRALCAAGRQSDALAVYDEIRRALADELGVDPSAELRDVHLAALRGEFAPPAPEADRLPVRLTSFVGRGDELKLLAELVAGARLVTLVGPGGAGKTRLATEAASRHDAHRRGRVWFVALAGVRDPDDVPGALLTALEVRDIRSSETELRRARTEPIDLAVEKLGAGESLLVLDNCEHLVDAAARLTDELLLRLPALRVLATSREPLAITGEMLCPVGPLPVPARPVAVAQAGDLDSVRLFLDRAAAARPDFVLDESTVDDVAQICRRLDGMPLALELAAARLRSMPVAQIAARLDDRFRLLTSGSRTALPRQRTLRAVVEWSWDLLTEAELVLARRLAVFTGSASLEGIERVCADDLLPATEVIYVLGSLVEKSIVDTVEDGRGTPRYRMLETLRAYATERLTDSGEGDAVRDRLLEYYAALVDEMEPRLRTAEQLDAISRYEAENDNLVAALRLAIELSDVDHSSRLLGGMLWHLTILGQGDRATGFIDDVLAFGDRIRPDIRASLRAIALLVHQVLPGPVRTREVVEVIEECEATRATDRFAALAIGLPMLAFLAGERELAWRTIRGALASDDPWQRAAGHWAESFILGDSGDIAEAAVAQNAAHAGFEAVGDRWGIAMTMSFKAIGLSENGDSAGALKLFREGLRLATELRSQDDIVQHWWRLAVEHARAGDLPTAWRELEAAERYAERIDNPQLKVAMTYGRIGLLLQSRELEQAKEQVSRLRRSIAELDTPFMGAHESEWLSLIEARIAVAEGRLADAEPLVAKNVRSTVARGDMPDLATAVEVLAVIRLHQHEAARAARMLGISALMRGRLDRGSLDVREVLEGLAGTREEDMTESRARSKEDGLRELLAELNLEDPREQDIGREW